MNAEESYKSGFIYRLRGLLIIFLGLSLATVIGHVFVYWGFSETNTVLIYLFFVFLSSLFANGYLYCILSSIFAIFAYNFFFTSPYFSFRVDDPAYIVTFAVMAITSIITNSLVIKLQKTAKEAQEKEKESSALYQITNGLTEAESLADIAGSAVKTVSDAFGCLAACLCFDAKGNPEKTYIQQQTKTEQIRRRIENGADLKERFSSMKEDFYVGDEFYEYAVRSGKKLLAVLRFPSKTAAELNSSQRKLLQSIIESTAISMDSFALAQEEAKTRMAAEREHYRSNLLRSVSHDLRTPLSEIIGASEMLIDITDKESEVCRISKDIHSSAEWLHALVENILNLTRLQDGKLVISKTLESVEEIASASAAVIEKRYPGRVIDINLPAAPVFVEIDARLISQVLINLLDNAVKHTPANKKIGIRISEENSEHLVEITVFDEGSGIPKEDLPFIFQSFFTASKRKNPDSKRGVGLGLAICESIVKAHGGSIKARNSENGAEFIFTLKAKEFVNEQ